MPEDRDRFADSFPAPFTAAERLDELPPGPVDFVLVTTKSFDSAAAAGDLAAHPHLLGDSGRIVLCQNGWGNAEIFAGLFPKPRVFNARIQRRCLTRWNNYCLSSRNILAKMRLPLVEP